MSIMANAGIRERKGIYPPVPGRLRVEPYPFRFEVQYSKFKMGNDAARRKWIASAKKSTPKDVEKQPVPIFCPGLVQGEKR